MTSGKRLLAKVAPYATLIKGIAHPHRLAILYLLSHEPMAPQDMVLHVPIRQNLLAHHLKAMVQAGWLKKRRQGKYMTYAIDARKFRELPKLLAETPLWRSVSGETNA